MCIETYPRVMNVKYSLQTKTNSEFYKRSDPLHDPVDKTCYFIRTYHGRFKKRTAEKKQIREKEDRSKVIKVYSKKQYVDIN